MSLINSPPSLSALRKKDKREFLVLFTSAQELTVTVTLSFLDEIEAQIYDLWWLLTSEDDVFKQRWPLILSLQIFSTTLFICPCLLVALSGIYHSPSIASRSQRLLSSGLTPDLARRCDMGNQILKSNLPISQPSLEGGTSWSKRSSCQVCEVCYWRERERKTEKDKRRGCGGQHKNCIIQEVNQILLILRTNNYT